jgi:hypothetical protein
MGSKEDADNRLRLWELAEGDPGADGDYALGEFACPGRREAKAGFWYVTSCRCWPTVKPAINEHKLKS